MPYIFRNLNCVNKMFFVEGKSQEFGCGILEWCWDLEDAKHILTKMQKDSRFSNLKIGNCWGENYDEDYQSSPEDFE